MNADPILEEVYRMKDALRRETGGDVEKLFKILHKAELQHPKRVVGVEQMRKMIEGKRAISQS